MTRRIATMLTTILLVASIALPASAAPSNKGTTFIDPSPITESVLVGVINPFTPSGDFVGFGVVGNPADGTIEHVGGLIVYSPFLDTELMLKNFTIDLNSGYVTGLVPGFGRVPLFMLDGLTLLFTETASQVLLGDNSIAGAVAGEAMPEWPFI
jgi:hypothetical protein